MGSRQINEGCRGKVKVEISALLLAKLISSGALTGHNCRCLDNNARSTLWQSLLNLSINSTTNLTTNLKSAEK
ncbi:MULTISPECIES: hypothetical protein [unclassified Colwellia]|uniref:hypothetical protein n=1 Tax=unclassified Colwellia TaxID=196834 RepID=UPI0015F528E0|nr:MULTISPECIES: hypothetical protein [unclassified Colwellia]MBA6223577.1 hypothetical protein [Colwellia sp. MB3u-45]MBA6269066.1 hypothetical protein [Colwellia sp. MB3u-43]MBA6289735.1 hypothetical protein [Colwellia sp. MB3u-4]MBA6295057.1 hypothetical protein [Colwellia sp. MB02u-9]MBA6320848.1 hypothetical protein [Colwellia sp. MB02u-19]